MADVEALGDVDGGIIQHDRLARAGMIASVSCALIQHRIDHLFGIGRAIDEEIQIALDRFHFGKKIRVNFAGERIGNHHRRFVQRLGKLKAGKRIIAHFRVRRNFQRRGDIRRQ